MQEIARLVLLERDLLAGQEAAGRRVLDRQRVRIDVLPVLDRDAPRLEQLAVRPEGLAGIRDRGLARRARADAARQRGDAREDV